MWFHKWGKCGCFVLMIKMTFLSTIRLTCNPTLRTIRVQRLNFLVEIKVLNLKLLLLLLDLLLLLIGIRILLIRHHLLLRGREVERRLEPVLLRCRQREPTTKPNEVLKSLTCSQFYKTFFSRKSRKSTFPLS